MAAPSKRLVEDLRGLTKLAVTATTNTTDLVETMHHTIALPHLPLGESRASKTSGLTAAVYDGVRGVTRLVGSSLDVAMGAVVPLLEASEPASTRRDNFLSVINGVYGDRLIESDNSLALEMKLFFNNEVLALAQAKSPAAHGRQREHYPTKLMVFVHGLCLNRHGWQKQSGNPSAELAQALGFAPIYLNYNTGLSIAANGAEFAEQLQNLVTQWPVPITELNIVGHSMGGLVARSACYHGEKKGHCWLHATKTLASIGTPHHGAPLEKGGKILDDILTLSPYAVPFTRLTKARSAGIESLRHGCISEVEGEFVQLPKGVEYFAIAGVLNKQANSIAENTLGDGLVPLNSALGQSRNANRMLSIQSERKWIAYNMGHNEMLCHPRVFAQLRRWLR